MSDTSSLSSGGSFLESREFVTPSVSPWKDESGRTVPRYSQGSVSVEKEIGNPSHIALQMDLRPYYFGVSDSALPYSSRVGLRDGPLRVREVVHKDPEGGQVESR